LVYSRVDFLIIKKADRIYIPFDRDLSHSQPFLYFCKVPFGTIRANTSTVHFGFARIVLFFTNLSEIKARATAHQTI
jgi:hypothetical protein